MKNLIMALIALCVMEYSAESKRLMITIKEGNVDISKMMFTDIKPNAVYIDNIINMMESTISIRNIPIILIRR